MEQTEGSPSVASVVPRSSFAGSLEPTSDFQNRAKPLRFLGLPENVPGKSLYGGTQGIGILSPVFRTTETRRSDK